MSEITHLGFPSLSLSPESLLDTRRSRYKYQNGLHLDRSPTRLQWSKTFSNVFRHEGQLRLSVPVGLSSQLLIFEISPLLILVNLVTSLFERPNMVRSTKELRWRFTKLLSTHFHVNGLRLKTQGFRTGQR